MSENILLELKPIQKFIAGVGERVEKYFGKDGGCVIGVEDDGVLYGQGLYQWLEQRSRRPAGKIRSGKQSRIFSVSKRDKADGSVKRITFTTMDDTGAGLEEEKIMGRKVLLVDNDIVTGSAYYRTMNFIRRRKEKFHLLDIKFAVLCDRMKVADFSIEEYPSPSWCNIKDLDRTDLEIIKALSPNGRTRFVDIAETIGLTAAGIKKRVERLINKDILKIYGSLNTEKFYTVSATVGIEAEPGVIAELIKKFESCPLICKLVKVSGRYNLIVDIIGPSPKRINDLIEKQIRSDAKVRSLEVSLGELPIVPRTHSLPNFIDSSCKCPCEKKCNECEYFL